MISKHAWIKRLRGVKMTGNQFRVLIMLSTYTDASGENGFPAVARLAEDCCLDRREVQRCLRALEVQKWIIKVSDGGNQVGFKRAAVYQLADLPDIHKGDTRTALKGDRRDTEGRQNGHLKGDTRTAPSVLSSDQDHTCLICNRPPWICREVQERTGFDHEFKDPTTKRRLTKRTLNPTDTNAWASL